MKRRLLLIGACVGAGLAAWLLIPLGLSQLDFFRVRQVEIVGLRYLTPETVLAGIALESDRNLFESLRELRQRATRVPGIESARVARKMPGTLQFDLVEEVPVAFAPGRVGLVPLGMDARPLPYDPSLSAFDLPLVSRPDTGLVKTLALIRETDSALFALVDAARRGRGNTVILDLGGQRVLVREDPTPAEIRAVEAVRWHLSQNAVAFSELDARYEGWVVVRREGA